MGASLELQLLRLNASVNQKLSERNRRLLLLANLTTFIFSSGEMKAWQAFGIGPGKNITLEGIKGNRCILLVSDAIFNSF